MNVNDILKKAEIKLKMTGQVIEFIETLKHTNEYTETWKNDAISAGNEMSANGYQYTIDANNAIIEHLSKLL